MAVFKLRPLPCLLVRSLVGLPASTSFEDLLGSKGAASAAKKGAMKGGAAATAGASRVGQVKRVTAHHLGDGKPLALELQVSSMRAQ